MRWLFASVSRSGLYRYPSKTIDVRFRRLREGDEEFVQPFRCGAEKYERDVAQWLRRFVWLQPLAEREDETWLATDHDADQRVAGYACWQHVRALGTSSPMHIEIAWFGVDINYQGSTLAEGDKLADRIYSTIETIARRHPQSTPDMPMTLVCHLDNERGRRFWTRHGYVPVGDPKYRFEDGVYERMVR